MLHKLFILKEKTKGVNFTIFLFKDVHKLGVNFTQKTVVSQEFLKMQTYSREESCPPSSPSMR